MGTSSGYRVVRRPHALVTGVLLAVAVLTPATSRAATYYLAPNGSDSNSGASPQTAWSTFAHALPVLQPGDSLVLVNGTYSAFAGGSGALSVDCSAGMSNGTAAQPITVRAESERGALLQGDGKSHVIHLSNCAYWRLEGLYVRGADEANSTRSPIILVEDSSDVAIRRLLVVRNNRAVNSHLVQMSASTRVLVEESEFYEFHRAAILVHGSNDCVVRRCYFNSRNDADLVGGYDSPYSTRGDHAIYVWSEGSGNIFENNISEGQAVAYSMTGIGVAAGNRYIANISLNERVGAYIEGGKDGIPSSNLPLSNHYKDMVILGSSLAGVYFRTAQDSRCDNCTLVGSQGNGLLADDAFAGGGQLTSYADNTLVMGFPDLGFEFVSQSDWRVRFPNAFGNGTPYTPLPGNFEDARSVDPQLGTCRVFVPASSPLKGAGLNGADIGANILFRSEAGILGNTPLWDIDGSFSCGVQVAGVNDLSGSSCYDVHERLNVNANGCTLPAEATPTLSVSDVTAHEGGGTVSVDRHAESPQRVRRDLRLGHRGRHRPLGKRLHGLERSRHHPARRLDLDHARHPPPPG